MDRVPDKSFVEQPNCQFLPERDEYHLHVWKPRLAAYAGLPRVSPWSANVPTNTLFVVGGYAARLDTAHVCPTCTAEPQIKPVDRPCFTRHRLVGILRELRDEFQPAIANACLRLAAYHGHADIVVATLNLGARVNAGNATSQTALMAAAGSGQTATVLTLLDGAIPPLDNPAGNSALLESIDGVAMPPFPSWGTKLLNWPKIDASDDQGNTALSYAAANGYPGILWILLERGTSLQTKINNGIADSYLAGFNAGNAVLFTVSRELFQPFALRQELSTLASMGFGFLKNLANTQWQRPFWTQPSNTAPHQAPSIDALASGSGMISKALRAALDAPDGNSVCIDLLIQHLSSARQDINQLQDGGLIALETLIATLATILEAALETQDQMLAQHWHQAANQLCAAHGMRHLLASSVLTALQQLLLHPAELSGRSQPATGKQYAAICTHVCSTAQTLKVFEDEQDDQVQAGIELYANTQSKSAGYRLPVKAAAALAAVAKIQARAIIRSTTAQREDFQAECLAVLAPMMEEDETTVIAALCQKQGLHGFIARELAAIWIRVRGQSEPLSEVKAALKQLDQQSNIAESIDLLRSPILQGFVFAQFNRLCE